MSSITLKDIAAFLITVIGTGLLVMLGFWQIERGAEKQLMKDAFDARVSEPAIELRGQSLNVEDHEYYRVSLSGWFEPENQILLDNQILNGVAGLSVIVPLRLDGTNIRILVNRGWVPWSMDRSRYREFTTPTDRQVLDGMLLHPSQDYYTLEETKPAKEETLWQNLDLAHYASVKSLSIQPLVLVLGPESNGMFERRWPEYKDDWIARHSGYSVQWFGLAVVLVILYLFSIIRLRKRVS